jgi:hypothetical protein
MAFAPKFTPCDEQGFAIGGSRTAVVPGGAGTTVVKSSAGRLCSIVVTTQGTTNAATVYDNASTGSGTVLAVVPASATAGTVLQINAPAANGITAVGGTTTAAFTVVYS